MAVHLRIEGSTASIVFDRPEAKNAFDTASLEALSGHVETLSRNDFVTALVIEGAGEVFMAGGDLKELARTSPEDGRRLAMRTRETLDRLAALPFPTFAALDGDAFGGGWEIAIACDIIVAAKSARIHFRQNAVGLPPAWGGGQRLMRRVGYNRALLLVSTAATLTAERAFELGVIDEIAHDGPARPAHSQAHHLAQKVASCSPDAVRMTKLGLRMGQDRPLPIAEDLEVELFGRLFGSDEHRLRAHAASQKRST